MKLKRHWRLDRDNKMVHIGPCPGGWFFAHAVCNDLPADRERTSVHDLAWMLDHGRVWLSNAEAEDEAREWVEVHSVDDLPVFRGVVHENYDSCVTTFGVYPYMPEFYWLPSDEGSRKALKKDAQRQYIPEYLKFREWDKKRRRFHEISWRRLYY